MAYKKGSRGVECILELLEGLPLHHGARLARPDPGPDASVGDGNDGDLHEADGADGPGEADARQQLADHGGEDEAAGGGAAGGDADGEGAVAVEVGGQHGEGRAEEAAVGDADADALREEELRVGGALGGGEDADGEEDAAKEEDGAEVARIGEAARKGADEEEQEDVEGPDPGNVAGGAVEERGVVGLKGAEGVGPAPAGRRVSLGAGRCVHGREMGRRGILGWLTMW